MNEAASFLYVGEFIGCALFCFLYGLRSRFWKTAMGVNVFAMMFVLAVLQGLSLIARVIAQEWFLEHATPLRFWSFLALFIVVWWRVIILVMIQHGDAVQARRDVADAHEEAFHAQRAKEALQDDLPERDGDSTDPDLRPVR